MVNLDITCIVVRVRGGAEFCPSTLYYINIHRIPLIVSRIFVEHIYIYTHMQIVCQILLA